MAPTLLGRALGRAIVLTAFLLSGARAAAATRRIDVGGFRLNLRCEGEGSPVVVLDSGAGDTLGAWDWVVPDVKKVTRVCAYDRAGLGRSDRGPSPRNSERIVAELHQLLVRARIPPPYVLVGHSFGGLNVRLYAARHPTEAAALVLVDATPEDYPGLAESLYSGIELEKLRTARAVAPLAFGDEIDAIAESAASVRAAPVAATLPVTVLTAVHRGDSPEFRAAWTDLQRKMAESFPGAQQIIAERSDHYIQFDEPELVVRAIREQVEAARIAGARRSPPAP